MLENLQAMPPSKWETATPQEKQDAEGFYQVYSQASYGVALGSVGLPSNTANKWLHTCAMIGGNLFEISEQGGLTGQDVYMLYCDDDSGVNYSNTSKLLKWEHLGGAEQACWEQVAAHGNKYLNDILRQMLTTESLLTTHDKIAVEAACEDLGIATVSELQILRQSMTTQPLQLTTSAATLFQRPAIAEHTLEQMTEIETDKIGCHHPVY